MTEQKTELFYKPSEVAEILSLHRQSIYRLLRSNEIPHIKVGGAWRIPSEEFDAYLERLKKN